MEAYVELPDCSVKYRMNGAGPVVCFVHGYLESLEIWDDLAKRLESDYTILRIDLPGHGKSKCSKDEISMEFMADCIAKVIDRLKIDKMYIVGHSMGGYVSLAFAEKCAQKLAGLCLFHSTPNPDTPEKRIGRQSDVALVKQGDKQQLVDNSIPRLFAEQNVSTMKNLVEYSKKIAFSTPDLGIIGALRGMASRSDRNNVIEQVEFPVAMIFGKYDRLIPLNVVEAMSEKHKKARIIMLNNSGHLGFIEEPNQATSAIKSLLTQVFS